jgi:hypothetical protein
MRRALALLIATLPFLPQFAEAERADCNALARTQVLQAFQSSWSDNSKLLFLSTLAQSEFLIAKEALDRSGKVSVGPLSVSSGTWTKEKQDQLRSELRKIVNVEQLRQSAASVVIFSGDPVSSKLVENCLAGGGLYLTLSDIGNSTAVIDLMWTSYPGSKPSAKIDSVTVINGMIIGGGSFSKEGAELQDKLKQRITIQRPEANKELAVIVNTKDAGSAQAYLPPFDLPPPPTTNVLIEGEPILVGSGAQFDGGRNPGCQTHEAQTCVRPKNGGKIVPASGKPRIINQSGRSGFKDARESPQEYCVTFWASTGACETPVFIRGLATAIEEYIASE